MKAIITFSLGLILTSGLWANTSLTQDFKSLIASYKVGLLANQAYCYKDAVTAPQGYQVNKMFPIASITKLFTTYLASELLDLNQRYETKIFIKGDQLHISGGNDPYFEEEKILLLMKALNEKGYSQFKKVSFDSRFKFSDVALGEHQVLTASHTASKLKIYFNTDSYRSYVKTKWNQVVNFAFEEGTTLDKEMSPQLVVEKIENLEINPLLDTAEIILTHKSKPLHSLLKSMNVMSKNLVAQYVYEQALQVQDLKSFLTSRGLDATQIIFYNGSGLPVKNGNTRKDNLTTCGIVISLTEKLNASLRQKGFEPEQIIAINGGKDNGSFRDRFLKYPETHQAVISKTGTLAISSTLAGTLKTLSGEIEFAIFNKPNSSVGARNFQDHFVTRMFHHLGEAAPIPYEKISIFPWSDSEFFEI